ncbi:hypothetical protein DCS_04190 [Drechmeria coniospora]|uniref:Uncharacterized protein n=1 Tax=Drechmeria coniospora TaxID=98403 RepID=A0A151GJ83_DRECN|nr:hypothetical protein DCS_04190 [Drechmeria coniospora]KYK57183.1 hypothetical protein DCS_04190 [Drechmeria coniospora]
MSRGVSADGSNWPTSTAAAGSPSCQRLWSHGWLVPSFTRVVLGRQFDVIPSRIGRRNKRIPVPRPWGLACDEVGQRRDGVAQIWCAPQQPPTMLRPASNSTAVNTTCFSPA